MIWPRRYYAGIGSRQTPSEMCSKLTLLATVLEKKGFVLRSGGAEGADKSFEKGVQSSANKIILRPRDCTKEARDLAATVHPAWHMCNNYAQELHGRNMQIILGRYLEEPAEFVIAWTMSIERGGTSTGLRLAKRHNIPCFNFADEEDFKKFLLFFSTLS